MAGAPTWQELVATKQQASRDAIPAAWKLSDDILNALEQPLAERPNRLMQADIPRKSGILTVRELEITEKYTVSQLLENLASGTFSSLEVTIAFSKRAAIAQQLTSCLTEIFFDQAQERAKQLDYARAQGQLVGPLHGLPISVKDSFKIVGKDATIGYSAYIGQVALQNSVLIEMLLKMGAVLYVKTNVPQTMMTADSQNNIWGRVLNPWNTSLTAGGSSGGEGALVGFRGSPLGVGTDVAGSVRIPAVCCGAYGFRPTVGRIPYGKQAYGVKPGMRFIHACAGPLANDFDALELFTKAVIDAEPNRYDSDVLGLPFRTTTRVTGKSKLRFGVLEQDPRWPFHPPVQRALNEAVALLNKAGHEILSVPSPKARIQDAVEVAWHVFGLDATARTHLDNIGEPFIQSIIQINDAWKSIDTQFTKDFEKLERLDRLAALNVKRAEIAEEWREIWTGLEIDAVIAPPAQCTAIPHDRFGIPPYTVLLNVLDYPAALIPFHTVRPDLDPEPMIMKPGQYGPNYDPAETAGAPCSIQIFTNRFRDEECLAVSRVVDEILRNAA